MQAPHALPHPRDKVTRPVTTHDDTARADDATDKVTETTETTDAAPSVETPTPDRADEAALDELDDDESPLGPDEALDPATRRRVGLLLSSILLVAMCSIIYELIIGTVSSYLLGNSVYQFSLTIGLYMSAMGLGSYLSRFVKTRLLESFFWVEIGVGILGGVCSALLFGVFTFSPYFQPAMWLVTIAIGTLVGLEIPLLTRYIRRYANLRSAIANVLSWDYIGALIGSLAFPLLLLPAFGLLNSAALIGLINISVAMIGLYVFRHELERPRRFILAGLLSAGLLITLFFTSGAYERFLDKFLFQDAVVYREQTPYQKLNLTAWRQDFRLYINGNIQFSSADEYRYHEALVHVPMAAASARDDVLILGGGDGLVIRQLRRYKDVKTITLVDLDPRMTRLASEHPALRRINEGAFDDKRVEIIHTDAMNYVMNTKKRFDVIIIDLPDPNNESLAKLYSVSFYRLVRARLKDEGAMVTQSSALYFAPNSFWSIHRTIEAAFCPAAGCDPKQPHVVPYHFWVPSFGDWGFNLAQRKPATPESWAPLVQTKVLTRKLIEHMLYFPPDVAEREVRINRLISPVLLSYYLRDWHRFNQ